MLTGRSKEGLHIIDLDNPYSPPRYLTHHTPWEVADVQWSPFASRDSWVVSTSNQKALVWNLGMKTAYDSIEFILHAHDRAITDINWSAHHPDMLATCAVDSFVHCWDLRTTDRPAMSFSDWFSGATQVKYNRQDPHVLASSHDRFLRVWDDRNGARPLRTIAAHDTKIYGIDWNRVRPGVIVTCSLDKTIKAWNCTSGDPVLEPEKVLYTSYPVWRARHTPFGWGVLAMPQRGNGDLHLYSRTYKHDNPEGNVPVHSFMGHKGQVKEFLWRIRGGIENNLDEREFQLISWGTDKELRLHRVTADVLKKVGYEKGKSWSRTFSLPREGANYRTFSDEPNISYPDIQAKPREYQQLSRSRSNIGSGQNEPIVPRSRAWNRGSFMGPSIRIHGQSAVRADMNPIAWMKRVKVAGFEVETLGDEISHVGEKFKKVKFEAVDMIHRKATIALHGPWGPDNESLFLAIDMKFSRRYPRSKIPSFTVQRTSSVTDQLAESITTELKRIAEAHMHVQKGCLEGVLRFLLGEHTSEEIILLARRQIDGMKSPEIEEDESSDEDDEVRKLRAPDIGLSTEEIPRPVNVDVQVPIPQACGAVWAKDGRLLCFFPPKKRSLFDAMDLGQIARLDRADKTFEAFGRLQTSSPNRRHSRDGGTGGTVTTDDGASADSSDEWSESTSTSGSSNGTSSMPTHIHAPKAWRGGSLFRTSRSADNSQRSTTGVGILRSSENEQPVIRIYDFSALLPSKRQLAEQYQIFGNRPDVCAHNMNVATNLGQHDIANVWGLIKLMLESQTPIETHLRGGSADVIDDPVLSFGSSGTVSASNAVDHDNEWKDEKSANRSLSLKMRWGEHPFGGHLLVPALFQYFERVGDIQMLGMLSCILYEHELDKKDVPEDRNLSTLHNEVLALGAVPLIQESQGKSQHPLSARTSGPKDSVYISTSHSSTHSSAGPTSWQVTDDTPPATYSTGTSPQNLGSNKNIAAHRPQNRPSSLSNSPDQPSHFRSNSNLLASSLSRSLPWSSSPPSHGTGSKKKPSLTDSLNLSGNVGSGSANYSSKPTTENDYVIASTSTDSKNELLKSSARPKTRKGFKVTMKNEELFDNHPRASVPLLDPNKSSLYKAYRVAYADLLFIWRLPIQRREILKLSDISDGTVSLFQKQPNRRDNVFSRRVFKPQGQVQYKGSGNGIDIQRHCGKCGEPLYVSVFSLDNSRIGDRTRCQNCDDPSRHVRPLPTRLYCIICGEIVSGMFAPCLYCGHVSCLECHRAWFTVKSPRHGPKNGGKAVTADGSRSAPLCPGGCECYCPQHTIFDVHPLSLSHGAETAKVPSASEQRPSRLFRSWLRRADNPHPHTQSSSPAQAQAHAHTHTSTQRTIPFMISNLARGRTTGLGIDHPAASKRTIGPIGSPIGGQLRAASELASMLPDGHAPPNMGGIHTNHSHAGAGGNESQNHAAGHYLSAVSGAAGTNGVGEGRRAPRRERLAHLSKMNTR